MRKIIVLTLPLLGLTLVFIQASLFIKANATSKQPSYELARLSDEISVRGGSRINLNDGHDLLTAYVGDSKPRQILEQNQAEPLALASADFDEDGTPDLISGYRGPDRGIITLHRGNVDAIYPNSPESQQRKMSGQFTDAPFLSHARVYEIPISAEFVAAGDFDADGHWDVAAAARGGDTIHLLPGDGQGNLDPAREIRLPGTITTFVSGEINRADGLEDLVVGVAAADGPKAIVLASPEGAFRAKPEILTLKAEPMALALGQWDDHPSIDLAIAAGRELILIYGRDQTLSLDGREIDQLSFPFIIRSIEIGAFTGHGQTDLALLSNDGTVHVVKKAKRLERWKSEVLASELRTHATRLIRARVSGTQTDDLVVVNSADGQLHIFNQGSNGANGTGCPFGPCGCAYAPRGARGQGPANLSNQPADPRPARRVSASARPEWASCAICSNSTPDPYSGLQVVTLDVEGEPVAVLPMRLNSDALNDLVILRKGSAQGGAGITLVPTSPNLIFRVVNTDDSGAGSLREAINQANQNPGPDTIVFDIQPPGPKTIRPGVALPPITGPTTIDGTTQPGFAGTPIIELDGSFVDVSSADGLSINAGASTVRGLVINRFPNGSGIVLTSAGNIIEGNFLGTNIGGTVDLGNDLNGVRITNGSNNVIGGTAASARNLVSGNERRGILIENGSTANLVQGNFVGTNAAGTAALGNGFGSGPLGVPTDGGIVLFASSNNTVGGTTAAARNLVSGNIDDGIGLENGSNNNSVQGNFVGTDVTGTVAIPNSGPGGGFGIFVRNSTNNLIGGTSAGARNVCSGNGISGINLFTTALIPGTSSNNTVQGNFIGVNAAGTAALPNATSGLRINGGDNNTIGGTAAGAGNVVSGNPVGVTFLNSGDGNTLQGNFIGTLANGTTPMPNTGDGINIDTNSLNNTIGGTAAGARNIIAFNGGRGINSLSGTGNGFLTNSIFSNASLGIDLSGDGVTPNDAGDADTGPNNLQNFPVLTSAQAVGVNTQIQGTLNSSANTAFRIEFFSNPACDASGNGEGTTFLGFTNVTTDGSGNATINVTLPVSVPAGNVVVATATDPASNTSEFSACVTVAPAACTITCPPNQTVNTSPNQCGAVVSFPAPTTTGQCSAVTCTPASGSFFPVGTTTVTCAEVSGGARCSFTVTVVDNTPPSVTCPANIRVPLPPGQQSAVADYALASATDNCPGTTVICLPPSGISFPLGTTTVTCTATDAARNTNTCSFTITVIDTVAPTISCPPNVVANAAQGQCIAVVNYPAPTASDNLPGTIVACVPPTGATFPVGTTTVNCTATDAAGNRANCSFAVTVNGPPQARVTLEGNRSALEFGPADPLRKVKKNPPRGCDCDGSFTIENTGCAQLRLTLSSIMRMGTDTTNGRITNTDDRLFFLVRLINPDQTEDEIDVGEAITIQPGQRRNFLALFRPVIPAAFPGKTTGLSATDVLPDLITSKLVFTPDGGSPIAINLNGRVSTQVELINPNNPRRAKSINFERSGNEFIVTAAAFDSNLNTKRIRFEFLNSRDQVVGQAIEVDLVQAIRASNIITGQSFIVVQRFSGAGSNRGIVSVRVTIFDDEGSDSATGALLATPTSNLSVQSLRPLGAVLFLPEVRLDSWLP